MPAIEKCSAPVFLPGKFQRQRSLVGYRPWGGKKSDPAKRLSTLQGANRIEMAPSAVSAHFTILCFALRPLLAQPSWKASRLMLILFADLS